MIRNTNSLGRFAPRLLGVLIVCLIPAALHAETVMFRNECRSPVVVQTAIVEKGVLRRDQPYLLRYGECTPKLKLGSEKVLTVYDGKCTRVLFRNSLKANKKPLYYSITYDPRRPNQVQVQINRKTPPPSMR